MRKSWERTYRKLNWWNRKLISSEPATSRTGFGASTGLFRLFRNSHFGLCFHETVRGITAVFATLIVFFFFGSCFRSSSSLTAEIIEIPLISLVMDKLSSNRERLHLEQLTNNRACRTMVLVICLIYSDMSRVLSVCELTRPVVPVKLFSKSLMWSLNSSLFNRITLTVAIVKLLPKHTFLPRLPISPRFVHSDDTGCKYY